MPSKYKIVFHSLVLATASFALFLSFVSNCLPINGDSAAYNQQIEDMNLHERTVHWGYIAVGILFTRMLPFPIDLSMNILAALLGAVGVSLTFLICYKLTNDVLAGYFSAAILLSSKTFFENSVFTDVYQAQTVFIMLALVFWLYQKSDILAAMFFLVAQLMNPITVVTIPLIFLSSFSYKRILKCIFYTLPLYTIFLYIYWHDLWYSPRGVLGTTSYGIYNYFPFFWRLRDTLYHTLYDFHFIVVFAVIGGVWILFSRNHVHMKFLGLITVVFTGLISCMPDNKFAKMQVFFPWLSITGGILAANLKNIASLMGKSLHLILFIIIVISPLFSICKTASDVFQNKISNKQFKMLCKDVNNAVKNDYFIVGDWSRSLLYERYNFHRIYTEKTFYPSKRGFEDIVLNKNICVLDQRTKDLIHKKFNIHLKEVKLREGIVWFK